MIQRGKLARFYAQRPPVQIEAAMVQIPWGMKQGVCRAYPDEVRLLGELEIKSMQPYGCTNLRMTELPFLEEGKTSK